MTDQEIARLQRLNEKIVQKKREIKEFLEAPVVESIYSEEADQYSDDEFILQKKEIWEIIPTEVSTLVKLCKQRKSILS